VKYLSNKNGFLGIDSKVNFKEKVVIVPFGLEKTVSYGGGTKNGPKEIIKASHQVELFDEELNKEPYKKIGIKTLKPFPIKNKIEKALDQLSKINEEIISNNKFPMVFGGEHSITPAAIKPIVKKYDKIVLLHFDAHADLRESYNGEKFSHASAIRRCLDFDNVKVVSFGIRNLSQPEMTYYENNRDRVEIFWGKDRKDWDLSKLKDHF
jgi:agmatinase